MTGSNGRPGVILTARDRHLLSELQILQVIDREQAKLFGPFGSTPRANARLLQLTRAGFLARTLVGAPGGKYVYRLPGRQDSRCAGAAPAVMFGVEHQLAINRLYHSFKYVPAQTPGVSFVDWQRFDPPLSPGIPLIPDGRLQVRTPAALVSLFVEVDCGTEALRIWREKVSRYLELAVSGEHRALFGLDRFRVLVVATTERRLEHIRREVACQTDKIFWLTTFDESQGGGAWNRIWRRPAGDARHFCF